MSEIGLKLVVDETARRSLWSRVRSLGDIDRTPRARVLNSIYFDTADHALHKAGLVLRLRKTGGRWTQAVMPGAIPGTGSAGSRVIECPAPGGRFALDRIPDAGLREHVSRRLGGGALIPIFETHLKRAAADIRVESGTRLTITLDVGDIVAGERTALVSEVEIVFVEGHAADLFSFAKALWPSGGLRFAGRATIERGYGLASSGDIEPPAAPRNAAAVDVRKSATTERTARDILRECLGHVVANIGVILDTADPEGPHQLRVGLRRLRSALSVFNPVLAGSEADRLRAEAQWLGTEVGRLRDVDAITADVVRPEAARFIDEPGFAPLIGALESEAVRRRDALRDALRSERVHGFVFDLARFIETRGWLVDLDIEQSSRLAMPISRFADEALDRRWRKVVKRGRHIESLSIEARHELRKELKKLRYLAEFLAPLYPKKQVTPFLKRLKNLQSLFGEFNDAQVARRVLDELPSERSDRAVSFDRAAGCVIGASQTRAALDWGKAGILWKDLRKTEPFWRTRRRRASRQGKPRAGGQRS